MRINYHNDHPHEVAKHEFDAESNLKYVSEPEPKPKNNIPPSSSFFSGLDQQFTDLSNCQTTTDPTTILPQTSDFAFLDLDTPLHQIIQPPPYTTPRDHYPPSIVSSYMNDYMPTYAYSDLNQPGTHPTQITPNPTTKRTTTHTTTSHQHQLTYIPDSHRIPNIIFLFLLQMTLSQSIVIRPFIIELH